MRVVLSDAPQAQYAGDSRGDVGNFADCVDLYQEPAPAVNLDEWRSFASKKLEPRTDQGFVGIVRTS